MTPARDELPFPPRLFHTRAGGHDCFEWYYPQNWVEEARVTTKEYLSLEEHESLMQERDEKVQEMHGKLIRMGREHRAGMREARAKAFEEAAILAKAHTGSPTDVFFNFCLIRDLEQSAEDALKPEAQGSEG